MNAEPVMQQKLVVAEQQTVVHAASSNKADKLSQGSIKFRQKRKSNVQLAKEDEIKQPLHGPKKTRRVVSHGGQLLGANDNSSMQEPDKHETEVPYLPSATLETSSSTGEWTRKASADDPPPALFVVKSGTGPSASVSSKGTVEDGQMQPPASV
jgi:hypothetical protein